MSGRGLFSLFVAMALGVLLGVMFFPRWKTHRALDAIVSPDPEARRDAWRWLQKPGVLRQAPALRKLDDIHTHLDGGDGPALLDARDVLDRLELWDWDRTPKTLRLATMDAAARSDTPERWRDVVDALDDAPDDVAAKDLTGIGSALLAVADRACARDAFDVLASRAGPGAVAWLLALPIPDDLARVRLLTVAWARRDPGPAPAAAAAREAWLLARLRYRPGDARPALDDEMVDGLDPGAVSYILRHADDPRALAALERRARGGDVTARFALQLARPGDDDAQSRRVLRNENLPIGRRRLAAWRWDRVDAETIAAILAGPVTGRRDEVYATALLAERRLAPEAARAQAAAWMTSFDDNEKRAGALLAALAGGPADVLQSAYDAENEGDVRTIQRLALWALGRRVDATRPLELARRALHAEDGFARGDVVTCMLLAADRDALTLLTRLEAGTNPIIQWRAWLIERFVPAWYADAGRPLGGNLAALRLHFDWLDARRTLYAGVRTFDPASKTFVEPAAP